VGIYLRRVEVESFVKSFLLFFISLSSLIWFLVHQTHKSDLHNLEDTIFTQMQIASFKDEQGIFKKSIVKKDTDIITNQFYSDKKDIFVFFENKNKPNSLVKVSYPIKSLNYDKNLIFKKSLEQFLKSLVLIFFVSIAFSLYALYPYKRYLKLTNEFIKDILHDFNTPISTIRLNLSVLKRKIQNRNIERIEGGVETILNLQNNLKEYLEDDIKKSEKFELKEIVEQRVNYMQDLYPHITFLTDIDEKILYCYKDGFVRIIDNILSNACKYNKKDGSVTIKLKNKTLEISDTGSGIKNPKKIFNRFYKETSRGLGIGLHIVKKLSKKMHIPISVNSELGIGTTFKLNLKELKGHL